MAVDFLLYCVGVGAVILSCAGAWRLIRGSGRGRQPSTSRPSEPNVTLPDQVGSELAARLKTFQETRYASPIVRRQLMARGTTPVVIRPKKEGQD